MTDTECSFLDDEGEEEEGELSRITRALSELVSAVGGLGVKGAENLFLVWGRLANGLVLHRFHKRSEVSFSVLLLFPSNIFILVATIRPTHHPSSHRNS